jgi:prolyl oligopeptidase
MPLRNDNGAFMQFFSLLSRSLPGVVMSISILSAAAASPPPLTPATPVIDTYFGKQVADPYRWMENMKSEVFRTWAREQADYAAAMLAAIPARDRLQARLAELSDAAENMAAIETAGSRLFYLKTEPGRNGRRLFVRDLKSGQERMLIDPDALPFDGADGAHHAIDFYTPSPDGSLLAVGISRGGSEDSVLRILDVAAGAWLADAIDGAGLNDNGIGWRPNGRSFFYNRLPPADKNGQRERYNKSAVYEHAIGQPVARDRAIFGYGVTLKRHFAVPDLPYVLTSPDSNYALAVVLHGDAVDRSYYIAPLSAVNGPDTPWRKIADPLDRVSNAYLHGGELFLQSHKSAPRYQLLRIDLGKPDLSRAKAVLPPGNAVLRDVAVAQDALYVRTLDGGVSRLQRIPYDGRPAVQVALPFDGTILEMVTHPQQPGAAIKLESWTEPPRIFTVGAGTAHVADSGLLAPSPVSFADIVSTRVMVRSHDGVQVPLSLVHRKGLKLDGGNPAILSGYGAYGISMEPRFVPNRLAWLERGGVIAVAHVRGGGEFGEEWHMGAHILNKANTIRDFIACAEYLIQQRYTSPQKLAGTGGSAGGITIGGAITERPELFAAAQSAVGLTDMLRMELTPNGPPNIAEFGTVTRKDHFEAMLAVSPYHRISFGAAYPGTIVTTGMNDPRVEAWLPAKFAARLQSATSSGKPVLLRIDYDAGHGIGSTKAQIIAETADVWSFFLWQMGDPEFQPAK